MVSFFHATEANQHKQTMTKSIAASNKNEKILLGVNPIRLVKTKLLIPKMIINRIKYEMYDIKYFHFCPINSKNHGKATRWEYSSLGEIFRGRRKTNSQVFYA